jgi:HSP20 family protein
MSLPAVDVHEDGNAYVVEAELPGVKKENVELRIGDNGQSLTIEGRTVIRGGNQHEAPKAIEGQAKDGQTQSVTTAEGSAGKHSFCTMLVGTIH